MRTGVFLKFTGLCGILIPIVTLIIVIISAQMTSGFSWTDNAISDLGRVEAASDFFNYGLIFVGILLFIFSLGLVVTLIEEKFATLMIFISSVFLILNGVFPLPSENHVYVSSLFFIAFPLGFFTLGFMLYKREFLIFRKMGFLALINVLIAAFSLVFLWTFDGIAIPEMIIIFPGFLWCMAFGYYMIFELS